MQPLTLTTPKPLIALDGQPMLAHALDKLQGAGVQHAVVNAHYLGEQIIEFADHWQGKMRLSVSDERDAILETGGGLKRALPLFSTPHIFCLNSDTHWLETTSNLSRLAAAFDPQTMDGLLLLARNDTSWGDVGAGDFFLKEDGRLARRGEAPTAPFTYTGAMVLNAPLVAGVAKEAFSLNEIFNGSLEAGRLFGLELEGRWMHVGTPHALEAVSRTLRELAGGRDGS